MSVETPINIRIAMYGGSRSGKTSLLAAMYENIVGTVRDVGLEIVQSDPSKTAVLEDHVDELRRLHRIVVNDPRLIHASAPRTDDTTTEDEREGRAFEFVLSGSDVDVATLRFYDFSGEDIRRHAKVVVDGLKQADILLVAIDAPIMVEAAADGDYYGLHKRRNLPEQLDGMIRDWQGPRPSAVLFCPIKCERWTRGIADREELLDAFMATHRTILRRLEERFPGTDVIFAPVETAGSVAYDRLVAHNPDEPFSPVNADPAYVAIEPSWSPRYSEQPFRWTLLEVTRHIGYAEIAAAGGGRFFQKLFAAVGTLYGRTGLPPLSAIEAVFDSATGLRAFKEATAQLADNRLLEPPYAVVVAGDITEAV